ncbi:MAG: ATP-dependent 6-phosphofructokinase [Spirochaetes bacterium]|nr:ATP-dependent 6-phosphofructokinase [Spirochaetota bacterium]
MKIGILTSGGDSPGINAFIRALYYILEKNNIELYGIYKGYTGLINNEIKKLTRVNVENITNFGGTILKTSKYNPLNDPEDIQKIINNYRNNNFDFIIICGDFDTLRIAKELHKKGLNIFGVPQTIDNDIPETDYTLGFFSAIRNIVNSIEIIRSTNESHERDILVEIMGKDSGWLTVFSALSVKVEGFFIPEREASLEKIAEVFINRRKNGSNDNIVLIAEGVQIENISKKVDPNLIYPTIDRSGIVMVIAEKLEAYLKEKPKAVILSYIQRGGNPDIFDIILASRFAEKIYNLIQNNICGVYVTIKDNELSYSPLDVLNNKIKHVSDYYIDLAYKMVNN